MSQTNVNEHYEQFGNCPECGALHIIDYKGHQWGACHDHKVYWFIGKVFGNDGDSKDAMKVLNGYRRLGDEGEAA